MRVCGPNRALCCLIISVWAAIQLTIMGIFFFINAINLMEDVPEPHSKLGESDFYDKSTHNYRKIAINCWIAAVLHILTALVYVWLIRYYRRWQSAV